MRSIRLQQQLQQRSCLQQRGSCLFPPRAPNLRGGGDEEGSEASPEKDINGTKSADSSARGPGVEAEAETEPEPARVAVVVSKDLKQAKRDSSSSLRKLRLPRNESEYSLDSAPSEPTRTPLQTPPIPLPRPCSARCCY